jgi:hypothetical protein
MAKVDLMNYSMYSIEHLAMRLMSHLLNYTLIRGKYGVFFLLTVSIVSDTEKLQKYLISVYWMFPIL